MFARGRADSRERAMLTILFLPVVLGLVAIGLSVALFRRAGSWCAGLLVVMLGSMTLGYGVAFLSATGWPPGATYSSLSSLLALVVGCVAPLMVVSLDRRFREQWRGQEELRKKERYYRELVELAPAALFSADAEGKGVFVNQSWCRLTGQRPEEAITGAWLHTVHPDDRQSAAEEWLRGVQEHQPCIQGETRLQRADGTTASVLTRAVAMMDHGGRTTGYVGVVTDVTEVKAEHELRQQSESKFKTIYENAPMMIAGFDQDGRCRFWNPACEKIMGWTQDEMAAARHPTWLLFPDRRERERVIETINRGDGVFREYSVAAKDGSRRAQLWAEFQLEDGTLISVGTDIAERKRAEEQLQRAYEELEKRIALRTAELSLANDALSRENSVRRRAEDAARQAQERLDYLVAVSPAVLSSARVSAGLPFTFVSSNITAQLGYAPEEIVEVPGFWEAHLHPEDKPRALAAMRGLLENGQAVSEYRFLGGDGTFRWLHNEARLVDGATGDVQEIVGCVIDISQRKQAEEARRESEGLFQKIFDEGPLGIAVVGPDLCFKKVNGRLCDILGYSREELSGMSFAHVTHPADIASELCLAQQLLDGKIPFYNMRKRYVTKRQRTAIVEITVFLIRADDGRPLYGVGMVQDVGERVRAQEDRDRIFNLSRDLMCVADFDGCLRMANPEYERALGYRREELASTSFVELVHPDDREVALAEFEKLRRGTPLNCLEVRWRCKDGTYKWLSWAAVAVRDLRAIYAVARDVTQVKQEKELMEKRKDEMAHLLRVHAMGEMASEIAHELKQPLCAIVNYANGIARQLKNGEAPGAHVSEGVTKIVNEGLRAGELIRHIRDFVTNRDWHVETVDLKVLVERAAELTEVGNGRRVQIKIEADPVLQPVIVDPMQIEQVLINLLRNAAEALGVTDTGRGTVLVKISPVSGGEVEVAVVDAGPGLSADSGEKIFDPFVTTKPSGMGMGLAISRRIIEAHGGRIWAESNMEGGATFRFTVPSASADCSSLAGETLDEVSPLRLQPTARSGGCASAGTET